MKRLLSLAAILLPLWVFAQGFGSFTYDQPYLAKDSASAAAPRFVDPNQYFYWVSTDIPGTRPLTNSTGWIDRIQSAVLTNSNPVKWFNVVSNYSDFTGDDYVQFTFGAALPKPWMIGWTVAVPGPWGLETLWDYGLSGGSSIGGGVILYRDTNLLRIGNTQIGAFGALNDGQIHDVCLYKDSGNLTHVYTNGVLNLDTDIGAGSIDIAGLGIGMQSDQSTRPFTGKIYELLVWTNTAGFDPSVVISNYHRYRTNAYGTYIPP